MSNAPTLIMVLLLVVLVFFMFRSSRKRRRDQADLQKKIAPGVDVMLSFGIYAKVVSIDEEENIAEVEIAPGTVIKVHRQTLGRVVDPVVADEAIESQTPAVEYGSASASESGTSPQRYSLNEDSAIPAEAPEFGERINLDKSASRDADKGNS